jgi:Tol biopolymer transport system component
MKNKQHIKKRVPFTAYIVAILFLPLLISFGKSPDHIVVRHPESNFHGDEIKTEISLSEIRSVKTDTDLVIRRVLSQKDTNPDDFVEMSPSPDGNQVAYVNMDNGGLYVRDLCTGEVNKLANGIPTFWHTSPRWSPDGKKVAVATTDQMTGITSIELIDVTTYKFSVVASGGTGSKQIIPTDWSEDGKSLLCISGHQLILIDLGESRKTVVADSAIEREGSLSPDGRFVVYAKQNGEVSRIYISPLSG